MTSQATASRRGGPGKGTLIASAAAVVLVVAMALDTTVVEIGSEQASQDQGFNAESFGEERFPEIQAGIRDRAVPAEQLAAAIAEDKAAAGEEYGTPGGIGPIMPVTFTGTAQDAKSGVYTFDVPNVPEELTIRVQTGPAINGTDLRDAPGDIEFGQFRNQIEYQNAGAALNTEMKEQVLADIDTANLSGKSVTVTGVFKLINPNNWLITPVEMSVQ
ncbi:Predicted lipoprotein [Tranquillimonas rosea]|uniref:Predicted lipoprotein n=1 Tax=Tranquillimonas rosea TaxID=641238 RepID=A0A1H9WQM0_9RHOB|nr:DUF2291 domain-containing protein [Tranquillimonas rosea]SES36089.1 Predicted lipoprotein [Tranquillimonas rosea]